MFIKRLNLKKILSFNDAEIELGPLNVLIGPNAVGKSNLIEVIGLLQAAPNSLAPAIVKGGGVRQWLWLGDDGGSSAAAVACTLNLAGGRHDGEFSYRLMFTTDEAGSLAIVDEQIADGPRPGNGTPRVHLQRVLNTLVVQPYGQEAQATYGQTITLPSSDSVLSQFKNPFDATPITEIGNHFARTRIFREFRTGANSPARFGISTSVPKDTLADGGDNLALVLHELDFLGVHDRIKVYLSRFCERFEDVKIKVGDGIAQAHLRETHLKGMLSAVRMSDGTLKFLSVLAVLFNPNPPPVVCIEEPELGLHPDALQLVAEALIEASERMQLIVTTHSEALVDAFSDRPESVLVCERDFDNGTQMKRLSKERLKVWLEHYSLGQLWRDGEIGGGRW